MDIDVKASDSSFIPSKAHKTDAGYDLRAAEETVIYPGQFAKIPTGVSIAMPNCVMATVRGRSGLASKGILAHIGTIDSGYRGEIQVILFNMSQNTLHVQRGDRIAQLVFDSVLTPDFKHVEAFSDETDRGSAGFGSTGR